MHRFLPGLFAAMLVLASTLTSAAGPSGWQIFAPLRYPPQLFQPEGLAMDSAGNLYVADAALGALQKLSPSAQPVRTWGVNDSGSASLDTPSAVALLAGQAFVADPGSGRVVVYGSSGYVTSWAVPGVNPQSPLAIGARAQKVYTLQVSSARTLLLREFSPGGRLVRTRTVRAHGSINASFAGHPGVQYQDAALGVAPALHGTVFLSFQQEVCSTGPDETCRVYQFLQRRKASGAFGGEWLVSLTGREFFPPPPSGLAVTALGRLLVPDNPQNAIYTYTPNGQRLDAWHGSSGLGSFADIGGIVAGYQGNVFVVGTNDQTVQKLGPGGGRLNLWGAIQSDTFNYPSGLAADGAGNVYLADTNNNRIKKLLPDGTTAGAWDDPNHPIDVALGPDYNVYVVDGNGGVRVFSPDGVLLHHWVRMGSGPGEMQNPQGIAVDARGVLYISDAGNHRVDRFSLAGLPLGSFGSRGSLPGQFGVMGRLAAAPTGNIYVADTSGARIEEFAPGGALIRTFSVQAAPWSPAGTVRAPLGVAVGASGAVFTAYGDTVEEIEPDGTHHFWGGYGLAPGHFNDAVDVALDPTGDLYVLDNNGTVPRNFRIERLHVTG